MGLTKAPFGEICLILSRLLYANQRWDVSLFSLVLIYYIYGLSDFDSVFLARFLSVLVFLDCFIAES